MKKHLRRAITNAVRDLPIEDLTFITLPGHNKVRFTYEGREKVITFSSTPKDSTTSALEVARDIRRFIRGRYK